MRAEQAWLHPTGADTLDAGAALAYLRDAGVLAAVQGGALEPGEPADAVLLLDADDRVLTVSEGSVTPGLDVTQLGRRLTADLSVGLETAEHHFAAPSLLPLLDDGADTVDGEGSQGCGEDCGCAAEFDPTGLPGDVLISQIVDSSLPMLAHHAEAGLERAWLDGWNVVRFDRACVDLTDAGWLPHEVPAALLINDGHSRYVELLTRWGTFPGEMLTRLLDLTATFTADEVDHPLVAGLANLHLLPDSDLRRVLASPAFRHLDAHRVAAALQSPDDAGWSARVLAALSLPTAAADVHEGRTALPAPLRVEPRTGLHTLIDTVVGYHDAGEEEVSRRTPLGKAYAWVHHRPTVAAAVYSAEAAAAALLVAHSTRSDVRRGVRVGARVAAAALLVDASLALVLRSRRT